jgi:TDG/mug DNA glycosylase family protein
MILPDLLEHELDIVFCGTAPGNKSAERKAYYAGSGNQFYPTLAKCGFTPRVLKPEEFSELRSYKIGLTDLVKHHYGMDKDLKFDHYDTIGFKEKMLRYQPKVVCFNGKEAAKVFLGQKNTAKVNYGLQEETINKALLYVAPSTSIKAFAYWDENIWQELKNLIK